MSNWDENNYLIVSMYPVSSYFIKDGNWLKWSNYWRLPALQESNNAYFPIIISAIYNSCIYRPAYVFTEKDNINLPNTKVIVS